MGADTSMLEAASEPAAPQSPTCEYLKSSNVVVVKWVPAPSVTEVHYALWLCRDGTEDWQAYSTETSGLDTTADVSFEAHYIHPRCQSPLKFPESICCCVHGLEQGQTYWAAVAATNEHGWSEYSISAVPVRLVEVQPTVQAPLRAPTFKRGAARLAPAPQKRRRVAQHQVSCSWPGCGCSFVEKRLDSDFQAYSCQDFVDRYAQVTGRTVRWERAPRAAQYCAAHTKARAVLLQELGCQKTRIADLSEAGWLHLHPEIDADTLDAISAWLAASKELFSSQSPKFVDDLKLGISEVWCLSNKEIDAVNGLGTRASHRWTYNPLNLAGNMASNRKLLVHGAPHDVIPAILENDLKMSGLELCSTTGSMLGEGVYFADSFMKSLQYVPPCEEVLVEENARRTTKYVFIAEVNVGKPLVCTMVGSPESPDPIYSGDDGITRKQVTFAPGSSFFSRSSVLRSGWAEGCRIPRAASKTLSSNPCHYPKNRSYTEFQQLRFNEWCVHDTQLFRIRYLVKLQSEQAV